MSNTTSDDRVSRSVSRPMILKSNSASYTLQQELGEGCYGKVSQAHFKTGGASQKVALKMLKVKAGHDINREALIYEQISVLDPDKHNLLRLYERFVDGEHTCLVLEMLDMNLLELLRKLKRPLTLAEIRPIAQQLLVAFDALKRVGVVHTDLKLDNVMLVNHKETPFKVKVIDFGESRLKSDLKIGMRLQALIYRSPEVVLGLPITEAIDMWSVGILLIRLFTKEIVSMNCDYNLIRFHMYLVGKPEDKLLNSGLYTRKFFRKTHVTDGSKWQLKSVEQYKSENYIKDIKIESFVRPSSLDCILKSFNRSIHDEDMMAFASLVKQLLHLDAEQRIKPHEARKHPFITMEHLTNSSASHCDNYMKKCHKYMAVCTKVNASSKAKGDKFLFLLKGLCIIKRKGKGLENKS